MRSCLKIFDTKKALLTSELEAFNSSKASRFKILNKISEILFFLAKRFRLYADLNKNMENMNFHSNILIEIDS
ncbi:hypothetical protein BpHYR1_024544 [Brachionus plicatilis]|uniref:Uncharacterized protein n=1 Tax=Brachionus plicatilis TaxID=10195 RepID=A0A3M7RY66_BRAPC|nr:hypothetical protein BpHYR1_024544 [Brachionus plicatilis]